MTGLKPAALIAGMDASTARLGYAASNGDLRSVVPTAGAEDIARRLSQIAGGVEYAVRHFPPLPALVVIEGYALGAPGRLSLVRLAELGGVLRLRLFELAIAFVEVSPSTLKRFATGKGNATKDEMLSAANDELSDPANHDEADAFWLRMLGRAVYGFEPGLLDQPHRLDAVANAGVTWPVLEGVRPCTP